MTLVRMHWVRHAMLAIAGAAVVFGCSSGDYHFVPDQPNQAPPDTMTPPGDDDDGGPVQPPPPPPPPSTPTACTGDEDCATKTTTTLCDTDAGYCVECDPAREADLHRCGEGTFCASDGRCQLGCQSDADCRGVSCDTTRGLCVTCTQDADCTPGTTCVEATCTPGCSGDEGCPFGWLCCDSACHNPQTEAEACGACGTVCDPGGACWNGVCGEGPCAMGTAECDGDASNGCETAVTDDPKNCGKCKLTCASNFCAGGQCTSMTCAPETADCNGREDDQCETDLTDVDNCVMCRTKCSDNHGTPSCGKNGCDISCDDGYDDCDKDVGNGCEINVNEDSDHCGDCDTQCENDHGTTECKAGECVPRCAGGYADCDGDPSNGCETNTDTAHGSCGACGKVCDPANATGTCTDGVCKPKCLDGFKDCDGDSKNGCEADLSAPETCGSCDNACSDKGGKATCVDPAKGTCDIKCDVGRADCVNGVADGCETDTTVSVGNCGSCGVQCTSTVGTPACADSKCGVSTCTDPNFECVADDGKKCETNITNDPANCGGCGNACYYKNGTGECVAKKCDLASCNTGYLDCNGLPGDGCESALGTTDNCTKCGDTCSNDFSGVSHGSNACTASGCQPTCASGWGDCDGNKNNGCETPLNTLSDCGSCNTPCVKAHGLPTCASRTCEIYSCNTGWDDCSTNEATAKDGCETSLTTPANCGGCGAACSNAHGTPQCGSNGQCIWPMCDTGYGDCTSQAGCETALNDPNHCLSCTTKCTNANGTTSCGAGGCVPVCSPTGHYASCDGDPNNGCETNLYDPAHCGSCTNVCSAPNATSTCPAGTCVAACDSNHLDCTSAPGCETQKGTSVCRTCTEVCSNAHGSSGCSLTTGCTFSCSDSSWGNCDNDATNGCETSLRTTTDCVTCKTACDVPNSGESCSTGACVATMCTPPFDDCDSSGTCETDLSTSTTSCGTCNHACVAQNGTNPCTAGVCTPACTTGFKSCDNNPDNGCEVALNANPNCGACGVNCATAFPNAPGTCSGSPVGACVQGTCNAGFGDCTAAAGCETNLNTSTSSCGTCNHACTAQNGSNPCSNGVCAPVCNTGFKSCDGSLDNGCEAALNASPNCGDCGVTCTFPNAPVACTGSPVGTCTHGACNAGFGDCNAGAGCESNLNTDPANCGVCTHACTAQNGTNPCTAGVCVPSCNTGFKNCDGNPDNGCEAALNASPNCGACGVNCATAFPNAAGTCSGSPVGACAQGACTVGYKDCTSSPGCETQLGQKDSNCSTCGDVCLNSNGTTSCVQQSAGVYQCTPVCAAGFGDCDTNHSNGCEANLTTPQACGSCGNVCSGSAPDCVNVGGTYRCQGRVKYENDVETTLVGNPPSLSLSHTLATNVTAANYRIVIAAIISQCTQTVGIAAARPTAVTYGGLAMTHSTTLEQANDASNPYDTPYIYYYYLTDGTTPPLPASGSQTLAVTAPSPNKVIMLGANVIEFSGAQQISPFIVGTGKSVTNAGATCTMTGPVTTTLGGAGLYALTAAHYFGTPITATGLTQSWGADNVSNSISIHGGYKDSWATPLAGATAFTIGFVYGYCAPAAVLPIAIIPYRQP